MNVFKIKYKCAENKKKLDTISHVSSLAI